MDRAGDRGDERGLPAIEPLGDRAWLARFEREDDAARWAAAARSLSIEGVSDVVLAYRSAAVYADPDVAEPEALRSRLAQIDLAGMADVRGRLHDLPVLYDGPDLDLVASQLGLDRSVVVAEHSSVVYSVFAIGFLPGFPYAGYLPASLSGLPRRADPRRSVPAGSVAIVGRQTGIYPGESPGGWHLLGRTPLCIADVDAGHFPIRAGDRIRFRAIDAVEFKARRDDRL